VFGLSEFAIILVVVIAVLAVKRLPGLARSAGKSARILKAEARAMKDEETPVAEGRAPRVIPGETVRREDSRDTDGIGGTGSAPGGARA
jgi:sec-independent protein translocase protein TatA